MPDRWTLADDPRTPDGAPVPMQQHSCYGAAAGELGSEAMWLEWRMGRRLFASAQVLRRRWPLVGQFALLSRGPVFTPDISQDEAATATRALIRALGPNHRGVIITSDTLAGTDPADGAGLLKMVAGGHVARLSLAPDLATLRTRLSQKWRNALRQAEAQTPTIRIEPMLPGTGEALFRHEAAQARARRYARLPPEFSRAWSRHGRTLLIEAGDRDAPLAGMLFLLHPPWASYHLAWTSEAGRRANLHRLMLWRAIAAMQADGIETLELGTLDTERTPDLARFKLGTGAHAVPLGATWMQAPGSRAMAALVRAVEPGPGAKGDSTAAQPETEKSIPSRSR
ncbi:GNAT family N-acetyltransferase [Rhodovulum marinum]|uniref:Acetyltransferase (GNAT) family protein n=1 Tax=Rhodovulum marinum TaxID=320662 RepID=A0A4R2Q1N9_9RHOB|nr:GNAT family N-acetyltransferase [Rhodovulum marinum]TCP42309.1 acetyltransferase (GNAT) family protein [Rhodovulum marinum]